MLNLVSALTNFDHWVVTRFNVKISDSSMKHLDTEWLRSRLDHLNRYAAPSLKAQEEVNWTWVVLVDSCSPGWLMDELQLMSPRPVIGVVTGTWSRSTLTDTLCLLGWRHGLTTRLDSDDALLPGYLKKVQKRATKGGPGVYFAPFGFQYCDGRFYWRPYPQNAFISLLDSEGKNVYDIDHWNLAGERLHLVRLRSGWLQVVHGDNLANEVRGLRVRGRRIARLLRESGIALPHDERREEGWISEALSTAMQMVLNSMMATQRLVRLSVATLRNAFRPNRQG